MKATECFLNFGVKAEYDFHLRYMKGYKQELCSVHFILNYIQHTSTFLAFSSLFTGKSQMQEPTHSALAFFYVSIFLKISTPIMHDL